MTGLFATPIVRKTDRNFPIESNIDKGIVCVLRRNIQVSEKSLWEGNNKLTNFEGWIIDLYHEKLYNK